MPSSEGVLLATVALWQVEAVMRLTVALLLGGLVGMEREYHGRAAGFRTHALVSLGCCLVMIVSMHFARLFPEPTYTQQSVLRIDPARIAYGVMAGIGFLGAGAIIRSGLSIRGLTTAASLWCIAAVGLAMGVGLYGVAIAATGLVLFTLFVLNYFEEHMPRRWYKRIRLICEDKPEQIVRFKELLENNGIRVLDVSFKRDFSKGQITITFNARLQERAMMTSVYQILDGHEGVCGVDLI